MPSQASTPGSPLLHRRKQNIQKPSESQSTDVEYTEEQLLAVEQIKKCKDYYEILGVEKEASESEIRKQYRKLALQFHPDKNKTPGAAEAFKAIGNAFAVLSDPAKRQQYDTYGPEAMQSNHANSERYDPYTNFYAGDITPEELFNAFFAGTQTYVRRGNQWHYYTRTGHASAHQQDNRSILVQVLPLLFIVTISFFSSLFVSDPPYSLHRTNKYIHEQKTRNLDISYYVKDNFMNDYKGRLQYIEKQVEEEYIMNIRSSCFRERNYKESMIWRAKHFKDITLETKAREMRTPSCDILNDLNRSIRQMQK